MEGDAARGDLGQVPCQGGRQVAAPVVRYGTAAAEGQRKKEYRRKKKREDDGAGLDTVCRSAGTVGKPSTVVVGIATATAC